MPEQFPQVNSVVVYELLQELRQDVREQHQRLRTDMNAGFDRLTTDERERQKAVADYRERLTAIETTLAERKTVTQGRMSVVVALVSSGMFALWQTLTHFLNWK